MTVVELSSFLQDDAIAQAADVRSLTVKIDRDQPPLFEEVVKDERHVLMYDTVATQASWTQLRRLSRVLQDMNDLTAFSLVVTSRSRNGKWLHRDHHRMSYVTGLAPRCVGQALICR